MTQAITTSIRLHPRLRKSLEQRAKREGRGKNWIISRALENYLQVTDSHGVEDEARRQSLLASGKDSGDWAEDADFEDWR